MSFVRPPRLRPGARVAVVAPSGPVPEDGFRQGAERLADRYQLVHDEALFARHGFLAGDDATRRAHLVHALARPDVDAVWCARGGYGLTRLLDDLDLRALAPWPRPIVGFSDVTALLGAFATVGVATIHGPVVTQLPHLPEADLSRAFAILEGDAPAAWTGLTPLAPGRAAGPLLGGNLEVLTRLVGTPHAPPLDGAILALEEIGERPYRLDRQLTHLLSSGALAGVRGVVVGDLIRCDEPPGTSTPDSPPPLDVFRERLARLGVPVVAGAPFGHGTRNQAFLHGGEVTVDADAGRVDFA